MNIAIAYFSQTGNTARVAEYIGRGLESDGHSCDLLPFIQADNIDTSEFSRYDVIGLGCPTFSYYEPYNVVLFIRRLRQLEGKKSFVFTSSGGHPGNTLPSLAGQLERKGLIIIGGFSCDGQTLQPPVSPYPGYGHKHPDEVDLQDAEHFGKTLAERMLYLAQDDPKTINDFSWLTDELYSTFGSNKPKSDDFLLEMTWDKERCKYPLCTLCMDYCPMRAIDLSRKTVKWRKACISCYFCEAICPYDAINFNERSIESVAELSSRLKKQYIYPEYFVRAKTELIGNRSTLYRQLVYPVTIDNLDAIFYKTQSQRPRYVVKPRSH